MTPIKVTPLDMAAIDRNGAPRLWGVCGWLGHAPASASSADTALAAMTDAAWRQGHSLKITAPGAALFLSDDTPGADLATTDSIIVGMFGYPQWSSSRLQSLAVEKGHAAAALEAYRSHAFDLLSELHGPFGLIVLDPDQGRALIAVDRAGIYPMYYASKTSGELAFATTATALARHPAMSRTISPQGLFDYMFFYRVPAPGSIFQGQAKLLPGQSVVIQDNQRQLRRYWQMPFTDDRNKNAGNKNAGNKNAGNKNAGNKNVGDKDVGRLKEELFSHLRAAVGNAVSGADLGRTGAFLSGGLDSSAVVGLLSEISDAPVKAFTVGFQAEAYDETDFAKTVAKAFGADHHVYYVTDEDVVGAVERIAEAYDEPFGNASAVPVYFCARFAREHGVSLLLAGDGGDELFAGNQVYLQMKIFELYGQIPRGLRRHVLEPLINAVAAPAWFGPLRKAQRYIAQANVPMPDRMFREELAQFANADTVLAADLAREVDPLHPLAILREVYHRQPAAALEQRMHLLDQQVVLADNDLRKVNRMCELAGVRVRFPLLDEEVMAFSARVPPELLLKGLELRAFYKQALKGYLPEKTIRKRKHGFGLPYGPLLEKGLRLHQVAYDSLASLKKRGYLRPDYIDSVMTRHRHSTHSVDAAPIWDLMMLELWCQKHL